MQSKNAYRRESMCGQRLPRPAKLIKIMQHRSPLRPYRPCDLALPRQRKILKRHQQPTIQDPLRQRFRHIVVANEAAWGSSEKKKSDGRTPDSAPESAGIQPRDVLDVSRELALEKVQALECRLVDWHERRQ